jgi:hypothetical protein
MDIIESSAHWMLKGSFRLEFLGHGGRFGRVLPSISIFLATCCTIAYPHFLYRLSSSPPLFSNHDAWVNAPIEFKWSTGSKTPLSLMILSLDFIPFVFANPIYLCLPGVLQKSNAEI